MRVETTLAYWLGTGEMLSRGAALVWLVLCIWLALNLTPPGP